MRLSKRSARIFAVSMCLAIAATCTGCKSSEVKNTETLINSIGDVTLSSGDAIDAASSAYAGLGDQQSKVENAQTLQDAEAAYSSLVEEKDGLVQAAIDAINAIGDVTIDSQAAIDAATAAYQAVPKEGREDITNYDTLVAATSTLNHLKKDAAEAAGKAAIAKLKTEKDEVEGITWYEPSSWPTYSNTRCYVLPYIGEQDGNRWLKCKVDYAGDDWVFFTQIVINVDGEKRDTVSFNYGDVTRDTAIGAKLYEAADFTPTSSQISLLRDIASSQKTIIRFQGSDFYYDFTVPDKDKQGINDVLDAYEYLK